MFYNWKPDRGSALPLHEQVSDYLRSLMNSGTLLPNDRLPGQRKLTEYMGVSRTTIITAFEQLRNEGMIISHPQSGFTVAPTKHSEGHTPDWEMYMKRAKYRPGMKEFRMWAGLGGLSSFSIGEDFSIIKYLRNTEQSINKLNSARHIDMYTKYGYQPLRESLAKHLASIGIMTSADNILICSSTFTATNIIYSGLATYGSNMIYEKPNLANTVTDIHSIGLNMTDISMDEYGISSKELAKIMHKYKNPILHLDTCDQLPTGIVMTKNRKREIMDLVRTYKIPVIEIEHTRDAWHEKPFPAPLKSMEGGGNIIYMGSFLRSYPLDIRICWIVAERRVIEHLCDVLIQIDDRPSMAMQAIANELFTSGAYYTMMENVRGFIKGRREAALDLCDKYLKPVAGWTEKNCVIHFWFDIPDVNTRSLFSRGNVANCYPGYFFDRDDTSHILFCPSSLAAGDIKGTVTALAERLKQHSK